MADTSYTLGEVKWPSIQFRGATGQENLQFRIWNGQFQVCVVKEKEFKAHFQRGLDVYKLFLIKKAIKSISEGAPGKKEPIVFSAFNKDMKKWETDWVFCVSKDEQMITHIEISFKNGKSDFPIKGPSGISIGSEPLTDGAKSAVGVGGLLLHLETVAPILPFANKKQAPGSYGGGGAKPTVAVDNGGDFF